MLVGYGLMCLIYGTSYFAIKLGLAEGMPPLLFAGLRFFLAAVLVLAVLAWRRQLVPLRLREWAEVALLGVLMTTIPFAALFWSEQHISSGTAALLVATAPVFTTLISVVCRQMSWRWYVPAGLLLSLAGTACLVGWPAAEPGGSIHALLGKWAIVVSELFFSWGAVRSRAWVARLTPFVFNGYQMLAASLVLLLLSAVTEPVSAVRFTGLSLAALAYLTVVVSIVASTLYYRLVQATNAAFPTTWTYVAPVIALAIGAVFLGEELTAASLAGSIGVLAGVILLNGESWARLFPLRTGGRLHVPPLDDK
ncbi:DMT family transporter [Brevibacillus thermoruber]|uniref:DMT family transporter n=1 Tax=Brevibacillus thermoruber TaxID=33942 RepID=UPI0006911AD6|nr:EamA family transporter [Brevibacillus thermoruber]